MNAIVATTGDATEISVRSDRSARSGGALGERCGSAEGTAASCSVGRNRGGFRDVGDVIHRRNAIDALVDGTASRNFARLPIAVVGVARASRVLRRRGIGVGLTPLRVGAVRALRCRDAFAGRRRIVAA